VLATGYKPDDLLTRELEGRVDEIYAIGDCTGPGRIAKAVEEGLSLALRL
jgi:pyruvate/2-oxoglutarate dehydrogenase complex dihydrolipoamide dehydrogenase (E3) component